MKEVWKTVPEYPRYEVSNLGRVRSYASKSTVNRTEPTPHLLKQTLDKTGYYRVRLHREGHSVFESVHRIVMLAFVGPCPDGKEACHNDGDRLNNFLDNLRWDTRINNFVDRDTHGRTHRGEQHHFTKFTEDDIRTIRQRAASGEVHRLIAIDYGVTRPTISYIVRRNTWKHVP